MTSRDSQVGLQQMARRHPTRLIDIDTLLHKFFSTCFFISQVSAFSRFLINLITFTTWQGTCDVQCFINTRHLTRHSIFSHTCQLLCEWAPITIVVRAPLNPKSSSSSSIALWRMIVQFCQRRSEPTARACRKRLATVPNTTKMHPPRAHRWTGTHEKLIQQLDARDRFGVQISPA